jgi:GNAT superfamily N-acetyltransferase
VRAAGLALAEGQDAALARDLYAAAATRWVEWGCFDHYAVLPMADAALTGAWFSLSFGQEQIHALCDLKSGEVGEIKEVGEMRVRRARPEDAGVLGELSVVIRQHQAGAPVWGVALPEAAEEAREGYAELASDSEVTVWLAERAGEVVGFQAYFPAAPGPDDLLVPEQCVELKVGGTRPGARGLGVGRALTAHGLAWARGEGYGHCLADWRSTNLLASRFWPRQGFRPMQQRLVRRMDGRVVWARGGRGGI